MFSLPKLIVLFLIIAGVWYGFRWAKLWQIRRSKQDQALKDKAAKEKKDADAAAQKQVEDMVKCPSCGTYVAALTGGSCGQPGCPATK